MPIPVNLQAVVDEMNFPSGEMVAYINCKTGEMLTFSGEDISCAEDDADDLCLPDWQKEIVADAKRALNNDDFTGLPDQYDIHEYSIMESFCSSLAEGRIKNILHQAISRKGAFRRFKDQISLLGVRDDWFNFKNDALKDIAAKFLKSHDIEYVDE